MSLSYSLKKNAYFLKRLWVVISHSIILLIMGGFAAVFMGYSTLYDALAVISLITLYARAIVRDLKRIPYPKEPS